MHQQGVSGVRQTARELTDGTPRAARPLGQYASSEYSSRRVGLPRAPTTVPSVTYVDNALTTLASAERRIDEMHTRGKRPIKLPESVLPEQLDGRQDTGGLFQQLRHVDRLTRRREGSEVVCATRQHVHGSVMILSLDVIQPDAELQNTLIQTSDVTRFSPPQVFQCLVLLKELAAIELRDAVEEEFWRGFVTPVAHRGGL